MQLTLGGFTSSPKSLAEFFAAHGEKSIKSWIVKLSATNKRVDSQVKIL